MAKRKITIYIDIKTNRAISELNNLKSKLKDVGTSGGKSLDGIKNSTGVLSMATKGLTTAVGGLVAGYAGLSGVRAIVAGIREEIEKMSKTTREALESLRAVQALTMMQGRGKEEADYLKQMTVKTGVKLGELAPAYYTLLGGTAGQKEEVQKALFQQAVMMKKVDPSTDLNDAVNLMTTIKNQYPDLSAQQIGNMASKTLEQAKSTTPQMTNALPRLLSTSKALKLDKETGPALFSLLSRGLGDPAEASTSANALLFGLVNPPQNIISEMESLGFDTSWPLEKKLLWLGKNGSRLSEQAAIQLGGRRGIKALPAIGFEEGALQKEKDIIKRGMYSPKGLMKQRLVNMYGEDKAQMFLDQTKSLEAANERFYMRDERARIDMAKKLRERITQARGSGAMTRGGRIAGAGVLDVFGAEPETFLSDPGDAMFKLLEEGYTWEDIENNILPLYEGNYSAVSDSLTIPEKYGKLHRGAGPDYEQYFRDVMESKKVKPTMLPEKKAVPVAKPKEVSMMNIGVLNNNWDSNMKTGIYPDTNATITDTA